MKKTLFIIASLLVTAYCVADDVVVGNHAKRDKNLQEQAVDPGKGYQFQSGDTIIISKDVKHYLTGEEPSEWVYYVRHIVGQVGGKRFPEGILVAGINSWVGPDGLFLVGASKQSPAAVDKQARDRDKVEARREELRNMDKAHRDAIEQDAKRNDMKVLERDNKPAERVRQPEEQQETRPAIREEQPVQANPAVVEEAPTQQVLTVEEEKPVENDTTIKRQIDRFTIGLRGGVASLLHNPVAAANGNWKPGFDVLLDLQYAHYWQKGEKPSYGILTGLSAGYVRSGVTSEVAYNIPSDGKLSYDINVKAREYDGAVLLEVPVMFSMITNSGLFFNVGPRFQLPVFNHYTQKVMDANGANIEALFEKEGVKVPDEIVTGRVATTSGVKQEMSKFNLLLGAELGYEWRLKNNNAFGVGVYASYGLFSLYNHTAAGQLVDVTAPTASSVGKVDFNSITSTFTQGNGFKFGANNGLDFFDCGLKLNYSFNFVKQ